MTEEQYVRFENDNGRIVRFRRRLHNLRLVLKYPFLKDGSRLLTTYLDHMPVGWRLAFGEDLCRDLKKAIKADGLQTSYKVYQVKEKFGQLRWYDNAPCPSNTNMAVDWYTGVSEMTCVSCGNSAEWLSKGWILPFCTTCKDRLVADYPNKEFTELAPF